LVLLHELGPYSVLLVLGKAFPMFGLGGGAGWDRELAALPLGESVSQSGISWRFDRPARAGQFVNGDWYVVGPVTVRAIDPKPLHGEEVPAPGSRAVALRRQESC
jgi:hypothetical protein